MVSQQMQQTNSLYNQQQMALPPNYAPVQHQQNPSLGMQQPLHSYSNSNQQVSNPYENGP